MRGFARDVYIIGVGMHRFGKFPDKDLKELTRVAVWRAIHDAGIDPKLIEGAYSANVLGGLITGQEAIRGHIFLRDAGFDGIPIVNVEGACASGSMAMREAAIVIASGMADVVLAVGAEKLFLDDTARSIKAMVSNTDVELIGALGFQFPASYAMKLRKYMNRYGWKQEHFAMVASKNKYNGSLNPDAQYRKPMSVDEILNSRVVCWPITLYMCSTMADGAAAVILCSKEVAERVSSNPLVSVAACCLRSGEAIGEDDGQRRVAMDAYETSGIGPEDIEVVEVHDAMAPGEMFRIEKLGLCKAEEVGERVEKDYFTLSGKLPVNTSGGLAARGHPIGATGLAQVTEIVLQLRGQAGERQVTGRHGPFPSIGLVQNSGGYIEGSPAALTVTILKR